ncbi:hypothetical protein KL942_001244 [Ogataea angusta]|uniref:Inner centromere protein ARK-binding domain-containing protein n=1 Tax=Pichia angusta TaxID=870730 RepID=A0ABQ7S123_PICAN|nr:hypothetical protein KL920_002168 [Ogataea angusta]KAG7834338.1 hypothetical protein KL943_002722 [Ogataea angusta]KAG7841365.1 hypothetical protein KL942_001244 [Ogataea angusta]KAG7851058.1 hypothetical protein KL940_001635 [Ogataea angusta]KAG7860094.1 hypothetical protein KL919_002799 [Ogataea angusta]
MWGVKAAARLKKQRESTVGNVDTATIPGFSKWFAQEVNVETKLIKSSVDQLGLAMMEHSEWINEVMHEVVSCSDVSDLSLLEDDQGKEQDKDQSMMVLLRSPAKLRRESSPVRDLYSQGVEMIQEQTNIVTQHSSKDNDDKEPSVHNSPQPEVSPVLEAESSKQDHLQLPVDKSPSQSPEARKLSVSESPKRLLSDNEESSDLSFDAISKNIRKSFARKTLMHEESSPKEEFTRPIAHETATTTPTDSVPKQREQPHQRPADASVLLDEGDIMLSDIDNDISFQIGKLEKIELAQIRIPLKADTQTSKLPSVNNSTTPNASRSPIKFAELPSREPLMIKQGKKKSISKFTNQPKRTAKQIRGPTQHLLRDENRDELSPFKDYGSFNSSITKQPYNLRLPPISDLSPSNTGSSEPTIKINRGLAYKSSPLQNELARSPNRSPSKQHNGSPKKSPSKYAHSDLLSRLMAPTEASTKRSKASPSKENMRLTKTPARLGIDDSRHKSQLLKSIKLEKHNEVTKATGSPSKSKSLIPTSKITKAPSERLTNLDKKIQNTKLSQLELKLPNELNRSKLPLTEQMLQPSSNKSQYGVGSPDAKSLIDLHKKLEKRKKSEHLMQAKRQRADIKLRKISVNHSKLNRLPEPATKSATEVTSSRPSKPVIIDANELPEISSDNEDDEASKQLAPWGTNANIKQLLRRQAKTNPSRVFGQIQKINCTEIFERSYYGSLNIKWNDSDVLGQKETEEYDRKMGYS